MLCVVGGIFLIATALGWLAIGKIEAQVILGLVLVAAVIAGPTST